MVEQPPDTNLAQQVNTVVAGELSPVETSEINEREQENLADGLAWGYYFGYLKLVLPKLEEQIAKSEQFRYKITMKKLFILLPQEGFTEDNIEDADDRVKWAGNLPECKINRGGIKARSYKHAVHRIEMPRPDGGVDEYHFVLEYATPLMTLYDLSEHAALSHQERDHQVVLFMQKLSYILEHSHECKGKYELVFLLETDTNKIADVVVGMYKDPKRRLEMNCLMVPQLVFLSSGQELSPVETSEINERENKNLADGLAWGYYFGYLKLVLPKLKEQIAASNQFRYKITMKKLFILLPQNCFTEDNIEDADDRVKWDGNLPEYKRNRGGIKARSYKHAVHRIEMPRPDGRGVDEYHFVLEYATPLMTLYDMSKHGGLSHQERDHQVVLFMRKLSYILEHSRECRGKYELVFLSETETNKIADVVVGVYRDAELRDAG